MAKSKDEIQILRFPDNVRLRTGMYLNSRNHCVDEIIENSVDQYMIGKCDKIICAVDGNKILVSDNGAGMPVEKSTDPEHKDESQLVVAMTTLHAGGKFNQKQGAKTGGLNGVGASCVNAVSSHYDVIVKKNGIVYTTKFEKGIVTEPTHETGTCKKSEHGTTTIFELDDTIWNNDVLDLNRIDNRMRQLAYLNPGLTMQVAIKTPELTKKASYHFDDGIKAYVDDLTSNKISLIDTVIIKDDVDGGKKVGSIGISCALKYSEGYSTEIKGFVNNIFTGYGGDHETGFKEGIAKAISKYAVTEKLIKSTSEIKQADTIEGLTAIVSIVVADPNYEGQGKNKIRMPEVRTACRELVSDFFYDYLQKDNVRAKKIVDKSLAAARAREAAKKARENARNSNKKNSKLATLGKLADCNTKDPSEAELWIVEGDSAAGSARDGRDPRTQAILPIFGKVKNAVKDSMSEDEVLKNDKLGLMYAALGCGIDDDFDISKLKYDKIMLFADADQDKVVPAGMQRIMNSLTHNEVSA